MNSSKPTEKNREQVLSDVDLAVEGLAPTAFFDAYSACRDLLPQGSYWHADPLAQMATAREP
jgi:hypothetical protein